MNAKSALIKEFLDGKTLTIMSCFKTVGLSNLPREVPRMIEQPFGCVISRRRMEGKSRHGSNITWYEYRLNPLIDGNKEAIVKMRKYLSEHMTEYRPKPKEQTPIATNDLFDELKP